MAQFSNPLAIALIFSTVKTGQEEEKKNHRDKKVKASSKDAQTKGTRERKRRRDFPNLATKVRHRTRPFSHSSDTNNTRTQIQFPRALKTPGGKDTTL